MTTPSPVEENPQDLPSPRPSRRRIRRRLAATLSVLVLMLVLTHRPLLTGYARLFRVDDPAPSDALIVLSETPATKAAEWYRRGLAPLLVTVSEGPFPFPDLNQTEVRRRILIRDGVASEAILVLGTARPFPDDRRKALEVGTYGRSHGWKRITVVAGAAETGRLRRIFRRALRGTGIDVRMACSPNPYFDEATWYTTDEGLVTYFIETIDRLFGLIAL
jgi:hypothetical protein